MFIEQIDRFIQSSRSHDGTIVCDGPLLGCGRSFCLIFAEQELPATDTSHGVGDIGRCIDNWATAFEDIVLRDLFGEYIERGSQRIGISGSCGPPQGRMGPNR